MMYKGLIFSMKKNTAIVITSDYDYYKIARKSTMYIGQEIKFKKTEVIDYKYIMKKVSAIAACVCLLVTIAVVVAKMQTQSIPVMQEFAFISLDINPSMEFTIDKSENVLNVESLSSDAEEIIKEIEIKGMKLYSAVTRAVDICKEKEIIDTKSKEYFLISGSVNSDEKIGKDRTENDDKLSKILNELKESLEKAYSGEQEIISIKSSSEDREVAMENNISQGKYAVYSELNRLGKEITMEEIKGSDMKVLLKMYIELSESAAVSAITPALIQVPTMIPTTTPTIEMPTIPMTTQIHTKTPIWITPSTTTPTPTILSTSSAHTYTSTSIITSLSVKDTANSTNWSIMSNIQVGDILFGDRVYKIKSLPLAYVGSHWIRAANDSKAYNASPLVTFTVTKDCSVYVAYDDRVSSKPSWLVEWFDTGDNLVDDETTNVSYSLYRKDFTANSLVSLGSNGASSGCCMYSIIVKAKDGTTLPIPTSTQILTGNSVDGFAQGTTGGAGGTSITVTTASDLRTAAESSTKISVTVAGSIDLGSEPLKVKSDKTIQGKDSSSTIKGNISIDNVSNVIIKNLNITNPTGAGSADGIEVSGSTKVYITKCTFIDCADGSLDIVRGSDYVTVSWNRFRDDYLNLIGNGDDVTTDAEKLHVTMHHNWFDSEAKSRMPRVRYGKVHVYNNYYGASGSNYNIGVGVYSQILVENCYFDNQRTAWSNASNSTSDQGKIQWNSGNVFVNTKIPTWAPNSDVFDPPYSYTMEPGSNVKSIVTAGAGNR